MKRTVLHRRALVEAFARTLLHHIVQVMTVVVEAAVVAVGLSAVSCCHTCFLYIPSA